MTEALLFAAAVLIGWGLGRRGVPAPVAQAARKVAEATGIKRGQRAADVPLPPDLEVLAESESEPWAREDLRAALRDRYLERGRSWDRVRTDVFGGQA